jgi:hypothetical protein
MSNGRRQACFSYDGRSSLTPCYEGRHWHSNIALRQIFRHLLHKSPRRKWRQRVWQLPPPLTLSTKDVHGMWITMWMSDQYHAVPQHLTHCPIGRQHNPCNFTEMQFFAETRIGGQHRSYAICSLFYGRALRSLRTDRAELGWQDIMNG